MLSYQEALATPAPDRAASYRIRPKTGILKLRSPRRNSLSNQTLP